MNDEQNMESMMIALAGVPKPASVSKQKPKSKWEKLVVGPTPEPSPTPDPTIMMLLEAIKQKIQDNIPLSPEEQEFIKMHNAKK